MKRLRQILFVAVLLAVSSPASASAEFGLSEFDVRFANQDKTPVTQAGSHPFSMTTSFETNYTETESESGEFKLEGSSIKDLILEQVEGFVGDADAIPRCSTADFGTLVNLLPSCSDKTVVGATASRLREPSFILPASVFNLEPPPGVPVRLGFVIVEVPVIIDIGVKHSPHHNVTANVLNIPQPLNVLGSVFQLWGVPADPVHDYARGNCISAASATPLVVDRELNLKEGGPTCPSDAPLVPFLTVPRACEGPLTTAYKADPWIDPGAWVFGSAETHDQLGNPEGFSGCSKLPFTPEISSEATTDQVETGTGLDFEIEFVDEVDPGNEGLTEPDGIAQSEIKKTVITLPEGVTVNPSIGEGLGVCTPADLNNETLATLYGAGCPNSSTIGTVEVQTPLLGEPVEGSVYLAQQDDPGTTIPGAENPFDSLLAFYIILKHPGLGILVKVPAKVEPDPETGQLITTVEDIPQLPFARFKFHFREGQRSALISPPACGTYETKAELTPWARPGEVRVQTSTFQITEGIGGGPCPPGGVPPFKPGFEAGSINNNAASYSPFYMRLTRADGEQDMTKFSSVLPPGVLGKLAGVSKCPDSAIEAAKQKTGRQELASPSCPANSQIGRSLAGAGVGSALTYVPGQIYLAGPYKGRPLSVVSLTPAVAGPFDAGAVVVRLALTLNPVSAEVEVDGAASDPIPHILKGIPLKVRDVRVYVDRPNFILNPTSCDPSSAKATLFGGFLDLFSAADDVPVGLSSRYQAANCSSLGFKPTLKLNLRGGTKRGDHPGLKATYKTRPGDANAAAAQVTLPRSAFLDQSHIRTICTRVQYAARQCPPGAIYGHAKAVTPLLEEPIEGPVYLRSSSNKLPDIVVGLKGLVDVDVSSRVDSKNGGIRNSFEVLPDAPVSEFILTLQGGKKGLVVNSRDLCEGKTSRAKARFVGQNGKAITLRPQLKPQCGGKGERG